MYRCGVVYIPTRNNKICEGTGIECNYYILHVNLT